MRHSTIRRWLLAAALCAGAWCAAEAADHDTAHAADTIPAVAAQPAQADLIGQLVDSLTTGTAARPDATPATSVPLAGHIDLTAAGATATSAAGSALTAEPTTDTAPPMLARLRHARARSSLPAGPATRLDPRPA